MIFGARNYNGTAIRGFSFPWMCTFCILTNQSREKCASSMNQLFLTWSSPSSNWCSIVFANVLRALMSAALSVWRIWIFYENNRKLWRMIPSSIIRHISAWTVFRRTESRERLLYHLQNDFNIACVSASRGISNRTIINVPCSLKFFLNILCCITFRFLPHYFFSKNCALF